jgi:histidinol-phosphatase (PHP family)
VAFTEHADLTPWVVPAAAASTLPEHFRVWLRADGVLAPPALDVAGYLECVVRCRERFPALRIVSGVELSEPQRHEGAVAELLRAGDFERVLGSVHSLPEVGGYSDVSALFGARPARQVVGEYLAEVVRLVESSCAFAVLAHIDYPVRYWPSDGERYAPAVFEEEFRAVLVALARSGRALEVNTRVPLHSEVVRGFRAAAEMVESCGFSPGRTPNEFWSRRAPRRG